MVTEHVEPETTPPPKSNDTDIWAIIERATNDDDAPRRQGTRATRVIGDDPTYLDYFKDTRPVIFYGFSSLANMIDHVERTPRHRPGWVNGDAEWSGTSSMSEALALARNGWIEGIDNAAEVLELFNIDHVRVKRRSYATAGGSVSVGRLLSGNPSHMRQRPKQPGRKVVKLFVQSVNSAFIKADCMITRAAIVAAIADMLERQGYSCEIVAVDCRETTGYGTTPIFQCAVTLKRAGEKLNLSDLAFALGHPSYLRRLSFALLSACDELNNNWHSQGIPKAAFDDAHKPKRNEFYIPKLTRNVDGHSLAEKAREMLPLIMPLNMPLKLVDTSSGII